MDGIFGKKGVFHLGESDAMSCERQQANNEGGKEIFQILRVAVLAMHHKPGLYGSASHMRKQRWMEVRYIPSQVACHHPSYAASVTMID